MNTAKQEPFGLHVNPADTCMLFKENELEVCIKITYVDDMLIWKKGTDTRFCIQNTERILSENPAQPYRLPGL